MIVDVLARVARFSRHMRGRTRVAERCFERWGGRSDGAWEIRMRRGHTVHLPRSAYQSWKPAFTGEYDEPELQLLIDEARPGTTVLDIGACFGLYAVPLAIAGREQGFRVVAFEPLPSNLATLGENLRRNGLTSEVQVERIALGSSAGVVEMRAERGGLGNAAVASHTIESGQYCRLRAGNEASTAPLRPLDEITRIDPCSVVKMDVEGFELEVLRGAAEFLHRNRPVIFGEFSPNWFAARGVSTQELLEWARESGYEVAELRRFRESRFSDRHRCLEIPLTRAGDRTIAGLTLRPTRASARTQSADPPRS